MNREGGTTQDRSLLVTLAWARGFFFLMTLAQLLAYLLSFLFPFTTEHMFLWLSSFNKVLARYGTNFFFRNDQGFIDGRPHRGSVSVVQFHLTILEEELRHDTQCVTNFAIDSPRLRPKKYYLNSPHGPFSRAVKCVIFSGVPQHG